MRKVAIYRHQLFKTSEPFIQQQADHLTAFRPVYVGRECFGPPVQGTELYVLQHLNVHPFQIAAHVLTRNPKLYENLLAHADISLFHAHFAVDGLYALKISRKMDIPLVTTFHGFDVTTSTGALLRSRKISWIHFALFRNELFRLCDQFIAVSEFIRKQAIRIGVPEQKIRTHYIGVDTKTIHPVSQKNGHEFLLLHVARLVEKKGTEYLIRAFQRVAKKFADVKLVIIGDGPRRQSLQELARSLGLSSRISFLGALPHHEVLRWMQQASVFCLPSVTAKTGDSEGLGMVLLEAAASGIPVIGTNHGGIPEAVQDEKTGFLVPERSVDELAERITYFIEHPAIRLKMGQAARQMAEEKFDIRKQTKTLEQIYEKLLRQG